MSRPLVDGEFDPVTAAANRAAAERRTREARERLRLQTEAAAKRAKAAADAKAAEVKRIADLKAKQAETAATLERTRLSAEKRAQAAAQRAQERAAQKAKDAAQRAQDAAKETTQRRSEIKPATIKDIQQGISRVGSDYENVFRSVTDSLVKSSEKASERSIELALEGRPIAGFGAYAVGTAIRSAKGAVEAVTFPIRPASWAGAVEAVGLMLMPEKGETQAEFRSRLTDMVKNDVYDPKQRAQMEKLLLSTMPPTPISSEDRQAAKAFRKALAESIMADPVGFLAEVAGGVAGGVLLSKALSKLTTGRIKTVDMTQSEYLEYLESHPWSGGMTASQESTWWLDQVVDDLVGRTKPGYVKGLSGKAGWKSSVKALQDARNALAQSAKGRTGMLKIPVEIPPIDISPWAMALITPGALNHIREGLRERGLTEKQIDNLLIDIGRSEEGTISGGEGVTIYQPAEWVKQVPETSLPGYTPRPVKEKPGQPDPTKPGYTPPPEEEKLDQPTPTVLDEPTPTVPDEPEPPRPDEPTPIKPDKPRPKTPKKPEEPTKPDEPGKPTIPLKPKGKDGRMRPNVFRALVGGMKEEYRVIFDYPKGPSETFTVTARSFPQALTQAQQKRRIKRWVPSEVDIAKVGRRTP